MQVLFFLIQNAVEYCKYEGWISISLSTLQLNNLLETSIENLGQGMDSVEIENIFNCTKDLIFDNHNSKKFAGNGLLRSK